MELILILLAFLHQEEVAGTVISKLSTHCAQSHSSSVAQRSYVGIENMLVNTESGRMQAAFDSYYSCVEGKPAKSASPTSDRALSASFHKDVRDRLLDLVCRQLGRSTSFYDTWGVLGLIQRLEGIAWLADQPSPVSQTQIVSLLTPLASLMPAVCSHLSPQPSTFLFPGYQAACFCLRRPSACLIFLLFCQPAHSQLRRLLLRLQNQLPFVESSGQVWTNPICWQACRSLVANGFKSPKASSFLQE